MAEKKVVIVSTTNKSTPATATTSTAATIPVKDKSGRLLASTLPLFEKENFKWMIIGAVVVALGMLLMAGGKNENPNQFDYNEVYSTMRVTVAPILIILGLLIEIYAIFKRPKAQHA